MAERLEFVNNVKRYCPGCLVGIPTLGVVDAEFMLSISNMQFPLNWRGMTYVIKGKPVDAARNELVERALAEGYQWVFFRDDDVLAPPDALNKLYSLKTPIAAGVVYGKLWPTHPMIFKWEDVGSYEDWKMGDVFEADWTGMGCTLIHTDVFRAIEPPWFETNPGSVVYDGGEIQGTTSHTEDAYFYKKAEAAGFKPIVDTNVQCIHMDVANGIKYFFEANLNTPVKVGAHPGQVWVYPTIEQRKERKCHTYPEEVPETVRFNLGSSEIAKEGYVNVDIVPGPGVDEVGDCRNLRWLTRKYGLADEVHASHLLEHFRVEDVPGIIRDWVHTLKPGGLLHIFVPDFEWACREFLERPKEDPAKYQHLLYMIFGQRGEGMTHQSGITAEMLMSLVPTLPIVGAEITVHADGSEIEGKPGSTRNGQEIEFVAMRCGDSVAGHGLLTSDAAGREDIPEAKSQMEELLAANDSGRCECGESARILPQDSATDSEQVCAETDSEN